MTGFVVGFFAAYLIAFVVLGACVAFSYLRSPPDVYPPEAAEAPEIDQLEALYALPAYIKEQSNG